VLHQASRITIRLAAGRKLAFSQVIVAERERILVGFLFRNCSLGGWVGVTPDLLEIHLVLELEVRVEVHHCVGLHGRLGNTEAPLAHKVLEGQLWPFVPLLHLLDVLSRPMKFQLLEHGIVGVNAPSCGVVVVEDPTDVHDVLDHTFGVLVTLTAVGPTVLGEGEGVVDTVILMGEIVVVGLPELLEFLCVVQLEIRGERATPVLERRLPVV